MSAPATDLTCALCGAEHATVGAWGLHAFTHHRAELVKAGVLPE